MSNTEFKKAFNDVSPDLYMETRILANIKDSKKKRFPVKPVLSGVLALAAVVACIGGVNYKNADTEYVDRPFSVIAAVASDDIEITEEISEESISLPMVKIEYLPDDTVETNLITGESKLSPSVTSYSNCGISVTGDDIDYVQYKSENGSLYYMGLMKVYYDIEHGDYYSVIIPVPDDRVEEVNGWINGAYVNPEEYALKKYAEKYDISEYFGSNDTDLDNYQAVFEKCSYFGYPENNDGYAFYLVTDDWGDRYGQYTMDGMEEITVQNYELSEKTLSGFTEEEIRSLSEVGYCPDEATSVLLDNPEINMSELPSDEITVTVTFKDGKKARKIISVSFNDDGYALFSYK